MLGPGISAISPSLVPCPELLKEGAQYWGGQAARPCLQGGLHPLLQLSGAPTESQAPRG